MVFYAHPLEYNSMLGTHKYMSFSVYMFLESRIGIEHILECLNEVSKENLNNKWWKEQKRDGRKQRKEEKEESKGLLIFFYNLLEHL